MGDDARFLFAMFTIISLKGGQQSDAFNTFSVNDLTFIS